MDSQPAEQELFTIHPGQRILAVVAHPDDMEYGASAAVASWTAAGAEVSYLLLTAGEAGIRSMDPSVAGGLRRDEQQQACAAVGVAELRILDFADGVLEPTLALRKAIATVIRQVRPATVLTMDWSVQMPWGLNQADHRAAGISTLDAVRDADNPWVFPELAEDPGLVPWSASELLVFGSAAPTHAVDVAGRPLERAIESLACHRVYLEELGGDMDPGEFLRQNTAGAARATGLELENAVSFRRYQM